jgi:hypothetical protein
LGATSSMTPYSHLNSRLNGISVMAASLLPLT